MHSLVRASGILGTEISGKLAAEGTLAWVALTVSSGRTRIQPATDSGLVNSFARMQRKDNLNE